MWEEVKRILQTSHSVAVVGLSPDRNRPSYQVATYLQRAGYDVTPVNPNCQSVLGKRCYGSLADVPGPVDIVTIFRRSEHVPPIVAQAVAKGVRMVWMQDGIINQEAAASARAAGLVTVMDRCIMRDHAGLHWKEN
ncbi:MAG TPA: CoA-binding protein [Firmicutes bacterium]|jgi:predicted CoA-binding protein|nr:CoA-binding protein [Bacillota bacterium]